MITTEVLSLLVSGTVPVPVKLKSEFRGVGWTMTEVGQAQRRDVWRELESQRQPPGEVSRELRQARRGPVTLAHGDKGQTQVQGHTCFSSEPRVPQSVPSRVCPPGAFRPKDHEKTSQRKTGWIWHSQKDHSEWVTGEWGTNWPSDGRVNAGWGTSIKIKWMWNDHKCFSIFWMNAWNEVYNHSWVSISNVSLISYHPRPHWSCVLLMWCGAHCETLWLMSRKKATHLKLAQW